MLELLTPILPYLLTALVTIAGFLGYGAVKEKRGRDKERRRANERDQENADDIRDRVERDLPDRVREAHDDAGWRD